MHPAAGYWDKGVRNVPDMTGAAGLLDGADLKCITEDMGIALPLKNVLDVGCGTGRIAFFCDGYLGVDIAQSAIDYCELHDIKARLIDGPMDLPHLRFDWITCFSVFTHIDADERNDYLEAFAKRSKHVLVDIIPGETESGGVELHRVPSAVFEAELGSLGFAIRGVHEYKWPDGRHHFGNQHRYYHLELA